MDLGVKEAELGFGVGRAELGAMRKVGGSKLLWVP